MIGLRASAKLTWYLEITGHRDDGWHDLRSEMVTIDFHDILVVDDDGDYLRVFAPGHDVPGDDTNLVARALRLVDRRAGVTVEKAIPVGGGLGGGSADAAAILRWSGGVSAELAATLGGDVPFCQLGGRALVEGMGERLTPLPFEARDVTLLMPSFGVNTAQCYRAYDDLRAEGWVPRGPNHLEEPAARVEPRLARTLEWLRSELGADVQVAGSGSTMFLPRQLRRDVSHWSVQGPDGPIRFLQTTTTPA